MTADQKLVPWWPDAAKELGGISRSKVYRMIRSGELASMTIGRRRFIAVRDIEEYIESRRLANRLVDGSEAA